MGLGRWGSKAKMSYRRVEQSKVQSKTGSQGSRGQPHERGDMRCGECWSGYGWMGRAAEWFPRLAVVLGMQKKTVAGVCWAVYVG